MDSYRGRHWNAFLEDSGMFPETQACKLKLGKGRADLLYAFARGFTRIFFSVNCKLF